MTRRSTARTTLGLGALAALALACAAHEDSEFALPFRGPGRLAVVWEYTVEEGELESALVLYDAGGARRLPGPAPVAARWIDPRRLVVTLDVPSEDPAEWGLTRLALLDAESGELRPFGEVRRHFDPEPARGGKLLALGVQVNDRGDSDLEIWSLEGEPELLGTRPESLDEPRWSPDGRRLVVARAMQESGDDGDATLAIGGVTMPFPRLFSLRYDLIGTPRMLRDGDPALESDLAPGGSVPLFWSERGVYARQQRGLVRCDPDAEGCTLGYDPGKNKRVIDARPLGEHGAWLLVMDTASQDRTASEIHALDLEAGTGSVVAVAPPGSSFSDLDWIEARAIEPNRP